MRLTKFPLGLKVKRCLFSIILPTLILCLYPKPFITQDILFFIKARSKFVIDSYAMHGIQNKLKKERKHLISAYEFDRSRYPTTLDAAILLYIYIECIMEKRKK